MICIYKYKGKSYTEAQFKELLLTDQNLAKRVIETAKYRMKSVAYLYDQNPQLKTVGSMAQYEKYLEDTGRSIQDPVDVEGFQIYRENLQAGKIFNEGDIADINQAIVSRLLSSLNPSEAIHIPTIKREAQRVFFALVKELKAKGMAEEAAFMMENRDQILGRNGYYENSVFEYLAAEVNVNSLEEFMDLTGENVKDHGQASYEINMIDTLSAKVKLLFASIPDTRVDTTFGGLRPLLGSNEAFNLLQQVLADINGNELSKVLTALEAREKMNKLEAPIYKRMAEILKQVEKTDPDILNQILYNLYQAKVEMKFVMWEMDKKTGYFTLQVYDANVKNPLFLKRNAFTENLKVGGLIDMYEGSYFNIDAEKAEDYKEKAQRLLDIYEKVAAVSELDPYSQEFRKAVAEEIPRNLLEDALKTFGIILNDQTYLNMYEGKIQDDFDIMNLLIGGANSIVGQQLQTLGVMESFSEQGIPLTLKKPPRLKDGFKVINPMTYKNSQVLDLIKADNSVEFIPMGSMYIAGKTINMFQQHNPISNKIKDLKSDLQKYIDVLDDDSILEEEKVPTGMIKRFLDAPMTSNSFLINTIQNNPVEALQYLDTFLISLEAIKKNGSKSQDDMGVTDLSDRDSFITLLGMFANSEGSYEDAIFTEKTGITLRKGLANFGTLSDSSQLPFLKSILLNITDSEVNTTEDVIGENLLNHMREQLLEADLKRIADFIIRVESSGIEGYDAGALWITGLPSLNSLPVEYTYEKNVKKEDGSKVEEEFTTKRSLIHLFREEMRAAKTLLNKTEYKTPEDKESAIKSLIESTINTFVEKHKEAINENIQDNILEDVNELVSKDNKSGLMFEADLVDAKGKIKASNGSENSDFFKNSKDNKLKTARLVAYDYVINTFLQQKEIQTIFAGDLAFYFKDKMGKNLSNELPPVTLEDLIDHYYPDGKENIKYNFIPDLKSFKRNNLTKAKREELFELYPNLAFSKEFVNKDADLQNEILLEAAYLGVNRMFKGVQNNLSKRLKGQISPGSQYANVTNLPDYMQIMVEDVEVGSETIENHIEIHYPKLFKDKKFLARVREFKALDNVYERTEEQEQRWKELYSDGYTDKKGNEIKPLKKEIPKIAAYLRTTSTDAQEYTTWKDNLDQLLSQGRITKSQYNSLKGKLEQQSKDILEEGRVLPNHLLTQEEMESMVMQPTKPLYSGLGTSNVNGHIMERYVYVKSSSFPLVPELTQNFPKLNALRKNIERIESENKQNVRVAYHSAVKVGGVKNMTNISALYNENMSEQDMDNIKNSAVILSRKNFYIQQDKPFKSDKNKEKGKQDRTTRATQFEKIILGDGINKITQKIFPARLFDRTLLDDLGIVVDNGMVNGPDLKKVYDELYKREQKVLSQQLFDELGIEAFEDIKNGKPEVMQELVNMANKRLSNKQDRKAMELMYIMEDESVLTAAELANSDLLPRKAYFKIPLFLTPNSRKLESVFNSIVAKNNINLTLPGYSFPVASQEGFDFRGYGQAVYAKALKDGLVVTRDFDPEKGLQASRTEDGRLEYAQVFMANKFKYFNKETGKQEYLNLKDYLDSDGFLDTKRIPEDLLSLFSFRIPTSAHQSGTIIKVVGFLPHTSGDLLIVPKDHTVQIGEDYDIDVRYAYQYNYMMTKDGNLKKMGYEDLKDLDIENLPDLAEARSQFQQGITELFDKYYDYRDERNDPNRRAKNAKKGKDENESPAQLKNPILEINRKTVFDIAVLETYIHKRDKKKEITEDYQDMVNSLLEDGETAEDAIGRLEAFLNTGRNTSKKTSDKLKKEYKDQKKFLFDNINAVEKVYEPYFRAKKYKVSEGKILENNIISVYKSVFSSASPEVQNLITSVLSTDFSEDSAVMIDEKSEKTKKNFNIYSPATQRKVMKLGADGKMGIGVHSNAVTLNSILQQLDEPLSLYKKEDLKTGEYISYNIKLGSNVFNGDLGVVKTKSGRRSSEFLMESQNSSTDNQKLEIMGRRNENAETISVFSLMQMAGLEEESLIKVDGKVHSVSYPSLFISQPIIKVFSEQVKKMSSSTSKEQNFDVANNVVENLRNTLVKTIGKDSELWYVNKKTGEKYPGVFAEHVKNQLGEDLTAQYLYDQIGKEQGTLVDMAMALYTLDAFNDLRGAATQIKELQDFVNIEGKGLGISYFDTINLKDRINAIPTLRFIKTKELRKPAKDQKGGFFESMFGEKIRISPSLSEEERSKQISEDAIFIARDNYGYETYIVPKNHYSHKIFTSIGMGYNLWNSIFPYDNPVLAGQIDEILQNTGIKEGSKRATELKYDIMSSMKDYSYTSGRKLFGDLQETRNKIFFDNKAIKQESLASYMARLRTMPNFKKLFDKPFFNELQLEVNSPGYPSVIKYTTDDVSKANNLKIYNTLLNMIDSKEPLPSKLNGQVMNYETLMKEILTYSLLSDQGNGAIGFRHLLPLPLFEKYHVDSVLRSRNDLEGTITNPNGHTILNLTYNGTYRALQEFLGIEVSNDVEPVIYLPVDKYSREQIEEFLLYLNSNHSYQTGEKEDVFTMIDDTSIAFNHYNRKDIDIAKNFAKQYIQHNPDKVAHTIYYGTPMLEEVLSDNNLTYDDLEYNTIPEISIKAETVFGENMRGNGDYITIQNSDGELMLYEKIHTYDGMTVVDHLMNMEDYDLRHTSTYITYKRVTTLGAFGFNEYDSNKAVSYSQVEQNTFEETFIDPLFIKKAPIVKTLKNEGTVDQIVESLFERTYLDENTNEIVSYRENMYSYAGTFDLIRSWLPDYSNLDIKIVDQLQSKAMFNMTNDGTGLIQISKDYLNNPNTTVNDLQATILEELIHYVTVGSIEDYINITAIQDDGTIIYDVVPGQTVPAALLKMMQVYKAAFKHFQDKYGEQKLAQMIENYNKSIETGVNLTSDNVAEEDAYRLINFHEFLAGLLLKDENFAKELSQVEYLQSGKSIIKSLLESLARLLTRILPAGTKRDSILMHGVESLTVFVEGHNKSTPPETNILQRFRKLPSNNTYNQASAVLNQIDTQFRSDAYILKPEQVATNPEKTKMFSGAAEGSDTFFGKVSLKYGVSTKDYVVNDLDKVTKKEGAKEEIENAYEQARKDLGRGKLSYNWNLGSKVKSNYAGGLVRRDYLQAKAADAVYAVGKLVHAGEVIVKDGKSYVINSTQVSGGTGYAVQMAINLGKPVFLYDQALNRWMSYNGSSWAPVPSESVKLSNRFAGIGTRELLPNGQKAIEELFENTFGAVENKEEIVKSPDTELKKNGKRKPPKLSQINLTGYISKDDGNNNISC